LSVGGLNASSDADLPHQLRCGQAVRLPPTRTAGRPDCMVLFIHMPDLDGSEVQRRLAGSGLPIIFTTAVKDGQAAAVSVKVHSDYLRGFPLSRRGQTVARTKASRFFGPLPVAAFRDWLSSLCCGYSPFPYTLRVFHRFCHQACLPFASIVRSVYPGLRASTGAGIFGGCVPGSRVKKWAAIVLPG
jgi:CheY-like chemotaxis protein